MANILRNFLIKSYTDRDVFASLHRYKNRSNGIGSMLLRLNSSTFSDANHRIIRRLLPFLSNLSPLFTLPPSLLLPLLSTSKSRHLGHAKEIRREEFFPRFFLFFFSLSLSLSLSFLVPSLEAKQRARRAERAKLKSNQQLDNSFRVRIIDRPSYYQLSIPSPPSTAHYPLSKLGYSRATRGTRYPRCPVDFPPPPPD